MRAQRGLLAAGVVAAALVFAWPQATEVGWLVATVFQLPGIALGVVAVVFYGRYRDRYDAALLGLASLFWIVTALSGQSSHPLVRDIALMGVNLPLGFLVHTLVALPGGRLRTRGAKFVVIATYLGTVAVDPLQTLTNTPCHGCAAQRVLYLDWPAVRTGVNAASVIVPVVYGVGIAWYQMARLRRESTAARRMVGPPTLASIVAALAFAAAGTLGNPNYSPTLRFEAQHRWSDALALASVLAFVVAALSFLVGIERANRGARNVAGLLPELFSAAESDLGRMIGDAIGDPTLTLDLAPGESAPPAAGGRALTNVEVDGCVVARMNHDDALLEQPALLDAARHALGVLFGERMRTGDAALARQVRELRQAFAAYVDPALADEIAAGRQPLRGTDAELTLLFLDVRGFTAYSDGRDPSQVVDQLNALWDLVVPLVTSNHGRANKFVGDGLLAVFGLDDPSRNHADDAVATALALAQQLSRNETAFSFGIGLNSGHAVVGSVGGGGRVDFTVIGDAVNTASRVEAVTRETGDAVLVSDATYTRLTRTDGLLHRGLFQLKGKADPVKLYALDARLASANPASNS